MNREIKFRAWLKETDTLIPSDQLLGFIYEPINSEMKHDRILKYSSEPTNTDLGYIIKEENSENYVLMQYIGAKDKNGKEIYEYDILEWEENGIKVRAMMEWHNSQSSFRMNKQSTIRVTADILEVVGNKFENPPLHKV